MTPFDGWANFYVIVGSSAGALIGLQFVVITLVAKRPRLNAGEAGTAFSTPSVIHFAVVLFLSAAANAPWKSIGPAAIIWTVAGIIGFVYTLGVFRRMRVQTVYKPVFEDWLCHAWLPLASYALLVVSAIVTSWTSRVALFLVGAATLLFLFVGIHNAWDGVTYHVFTHIANKRESEKRD